MHKSLAHWACAADEDMTCEAGLTSKQIVMSDCMLMCRDSSVLKVVVSTIGAVPYMM